MPVSTGFYPLIVRPRPYGFPRRTAGDGSGCKQAISLSVLPVVFPFGQMTLITDFMGPLAAEDPAVNSGGMSHRSYG